MNIIETTIHKSPVGELIIGTIDNKCCLLEFRHRKLIGKIIPTKKKYYNAELVEKKNELHDLIISQLDQYFEGELEEFDFPFEYRGTEFQERVWSELLKIPYAETISYQELSERIGNPKAIRAVGTANGFNSLAIVIPCHRVIAKNGNLQGYGGGLSNKKKLLDLEKKSKIEPETLNEWF